MKTLSDILNGINSVGLGEISDVGLSATEWYVVPKAFLKIPRVKVTKESEEAKAYSEGVADFVKNIKERDNTFANAIENGKICFKDGGEVQIEVDDLTTKDFDTTIATIYDHYAKMDLEKRMIKTALNVLAINYGFIQLSKFDECSIIDNLAEIAEDAKANIAKVKAFIEENATRLIALMVAVGINHWMTNHCLGSLDKIALLEKVWFMCPFSSTIKEKGGNLKSTLYNLLHSVNKRNSLFAISDQIKGLSGIFTPGMRDIKRFEPDKAFKLRLSTLPAGNKKIETAISLYKFAYENEILDISRSIAFFKDILVLEKKVRDAGVLAHIGAYYYSFKSKKEGKYVDYVNTKVEEVIADYGNMLLAVASSHTLASSPIVLRAVESSIRKPIADLAKAIVKARNESADEYVKKLMETKASKLKESSEFDEMTVAASKFFSKVADEESE